MLVPLQFRLLELKILIYLSLNEVVPLIVCCFNLISFYSIFIYC